MCRCTNRLDSSAVVALRNLRDGGKQSIKRAPAACSGAPARWGNHPGIKRTPEFWHLQCSLNLYMKTSRAACHQGALILTRYPDLVHLSVQSVPKTRTEVSFSLFQEFNFASSLFKKLGVFWGSSKQDQRCVSHLRPSALQQLH